MSTVKIHELIGSEGRSRVNVSKLALKDLPASEDVVLDFSNVNFLSRSFTDEIITQLEGKAFTIKNANNVITNMFKAVIDGRSKARIHPNHHSSVLSFSSMAELSRFLNVSL